MWMVYNDSYEQNTTIKFTDSEYDRCRRSGGKTDGCC